MKINKEQYFWIQNKLNGMANKLFALEKQLKKLNTKISKEVKK